MILKLVFTLLAFYVLVLLAWPHLPVGVAIGISFTPLASFIGCFLAHWYSNPDFRNELFPKAG